MWQMAEAPMADRGAQQKRAREKTREWSGPERGAEMKEIAQAQERDARWEEEVRREPQSGARER